MDAYDIIARMLNKFGHAALVVLALYLSWAAFGNRPFVVAATFVSAHVVHALASNDADPRLRQADDLHEISRRSRRLAQTVLSESDRRLLTFYADEMDDAARRMRQEASAARPSAPAHPKLGGR
jgi:hypothetical protein